MMHIVNNQVTHISLHHYCTKSQQGLLQPSYFVIHHLHLVEPYIYHAAVEQTLLSDLYKSLISDNVHTVKPRNPGWHKKKQPYNKTDRQAPKKPAKTKCRLYGR